ncbi:NUDIX hydrolase [Luedemannella flava]|uniref:NUDIX hydrolase n=1 Tax=Luedemannella flava TaxID=349316 RepID=A0ABP4XZD3_9ACTN
MRSWAPFPAPRIWAVTLPYVTHPLFDDTVRVLREWSPDATRDSFLDLLRDGPAALARAHRPGHVTASAVVLNADLDRVLLCLHGRFGVWVQVGGHCEVDDGSLADAALREATEESGIDGLRVSATPVDLDIHPVTCSAGPSVHYDVRYAAVAPAGATAKVSAESRALGWFAPDDLPTPLASSTDRAVRAAVTAVTRTGGRPAP